MTGLVLAGGRARRMGGRDKGLVPVGGRPMVAWVVDALEAQCAEVLVNANRNAADYAAVTGCAVIADRDRDFAGPLSGLASALGDVPTPLVVTCPCDSPLVRPDLVSRLVQALEAERAEIAVAHDGERMQPVFALIARELAASLDAFLAGGGRKIDRWFEGHRTTLADFRDAPEMFLNINTEEDRDALEARLAARGR